MKRKCSTIKLVIKVVITNMVKKGHAKFIVDVTFLPFLWELSAENSGS